MLIGESLPELLRRPFCGRVVGYIAMQDSPRADFHRDEGIEDAEIGGNHGEKIAATMPLA
jgi:hypothetical protein